MLAGQAQIGNYVSVASEFVLEDEDGGRTVVVTGSWSDRAARTLRKAEADGLTLNYARGFSEGSLGFLQDWPLRRLNILDRSIVDLEPVGRLAGSLEVLSVQASSQARLSLPPMPMLRSLAGEWSLVRSTAMEADRLEALVTWRFDEVNLLALIGMARLARLTVKEAPHLESLEGLQALRSLSEVGIHLARRLSDITPVGHLGATLRALRFEDCARISDLTPIASLTGLREFWVGDCGTIASLQPLTLMSELEFFYAWGATLIADGDLSPLLGLDRLSDLRMKPRSEYRPTLAEVQARLGTTGH